MLALILGIFYVTIAAAVASLYAPFRLDGIDVGDGDANGNRRQQHEHNHQDYLHGTGLVCVEGLELMLRYRFQPKWLHPMSNVA